MATLPKSADARHGSLSPSVPPREERLRKKARHHRRRVGAL